MDLAERIKNWMGEQSELNAILIAPDVVDLESGNDEAIGISAPMPVAESNYGGASDELRQALTITTVTRTHNKSMEMEAAIARLQNFTEPNGTLKILGLFLVNSSRTLLDDKLIQSTYNFQVIRG